MKTLFNINDTHIGAIRSGGTTPATALFLRQQALQAFSNLLDQCRNGDLIINGDTFDTQNIPYTDLWEAVRLLSEWLTENRTGKLYLPVGNHDVPKNTANLSSFGLLCKILVAMRPAQVVAITIPTYVEDHDAWIIPHVPNQDIFDACLATIPACKLLFVHVNYDNKFAVESDHSLNMSVEQAKACKAERIIFGHEHQAKLALGGKVIIVGNQIPTSISDCLGNDKKFMLRIEDGEIEHIPVWEAKGDYCEMDWHSLEDNGCRFIRVVGSAANAEAGDVASAISRFRGKSAALIITNATKVEGINDQDEMELNAEEIAAFDVRSALMEILNDEEKAIVNKLQSVENV